MGPRRRPTLVAALAITGLLAACGSPSAASPPAASPSPTESPAAEAPTEAATSEAPGSSPAAEVPTSGRIELADEGYAMTLPDNWFRVPLDEEGMKQLLEEGAGGLPEGFDKLMTEQVRQMLANGVSLLAYRDADDDAIVGTNINVLSLPTYGLQLDTIESLNKAQLQQMLGDGGTIESSRVTLPSGEAILMTYAFDSTDGGSNRIEQYYLLGGGQQLIMTCTVPGAGDIADECRAVAESIEFLS